MQCICGECHRSVYRVTVNDVIDYRIDLALQIIRVESALNNDVRNLGSSSFYALTNGRIN